MRFLLAAVMFSISLPALAQHHQPYSGMEKRRIKALSEQQIEDLKAGRGIGLALPAELHGYPGPMHVLEHADALQLSMEQRKRTTELLQQMRSEAIPLGEKIIEREVELDQMFAARRITPEALRVSTDAIGREQGRLRETHLRYHLAMMEVLTSDQVARYRALRGYDKPGRRHHHHSR